MSPTLHDIARKTQTSISTVSRVLSGGTTAQRISAETRTRVLAAAKTLGYRPNLLARGLRTRRTQTVALLVSDIANPWFGQIAGLIEQSLHRHGYSLILCNSGEDADREAEYLRLLPQKGIDGLILVPIVKTRKALAEFLPGDMPLVLLDRTIPGVGASVSSDEEQLCAVLCNTLARNLVRDVAIVSGPRHIPTHRRRAEMVGSCFNVVAHYEGPAQRDTGHKAFLRLCGEDADDGGRPPQAIVCTNNLLGQGLIDAIGRLEKPPIIACFDEIVNMHLLPLPIVCSLQDLPLLAEGCVTQLLPQLNGEPFKPRPLLLPPRAVTNPAFQSRQLEKPSVK